MTAASRMKPSMFSAAVTLLLILSLKTLASVFIYYNISLLASPVSPLVKLGTSNDPSYVSVSLGVNRTNASIVVNASSTTNYTIGLEYRAAVYWSSFDTDPFASGEIYVKNPDTACNWSWDPNGYISVSATGTAASEGGECIVLVNRTVDASQHVYINYVFRINGGDGYVDTIFYGDPNVSPGEFYTVGVNATYFIFGYYRASATAWYYNGANWVFLNTTRLSLIRGGVWYDLTSYRDDITGLLTLESGAQNRILTAVETSVDVKRAGVGVYYLGGGTFSVDFDLLLITVGAPPYYVNVTGLQPGWYVRILDSNGNVLANATSNGDTVSLEAWQWKFARNATIEVYTDQTLTTLIARATFAWIVGGDRYRVSNSTLQVFNLFNYTSLDSSYTYSTGMRLVNYTIVSGNFSNISLWVQVADSVSSRIEIVNGTLTTSNETSPVQLPPQYTGYAYIAVSADPGSEARLKVRLYYEIGGVRVEYPVEVTVRT